MSLTICVLTYGAADPARRCLSSLLQALHQPYPRDLVREVRVGVNKGTGGLVGAVRGFAHLCPVPVCVYREQFDNNVGKYPMMRRMFWGPPEELKTSHVLWMDDDTVLGIDPKSSWLDRLAAEVVRAEVVGPIYRTSINDKKPYWPRSDAQAEEIRKQPWYKGKAFLERTPFAQGGFWAAQVKFLKKWDFPHKAFRHNANGDVFLGEIVRQQGLRLNDFSHGVFENSDARATKSAAPTRGDRTPPPWVDGPDDGAAYHDFDVAVERYGP